MATEELPIPDWIDDQPTAVESEPVTAPHAAGAGLARAEAYRASRRAEDHRQWFEEGQRDAIAALRGFLARRGLTDPEIENIALAVRQGLSRL